jgi:hypothetical protein
MDARVIGNGEYATLPALWRAVSCSSTRTRSGADSDDDRNDGSWGCPIMTVTVAVRTVCLPPQAKRVAKPLREESLATRLSERLTDAEFAKYGEANRKKQ